MSERKYLKDYSTEELEKEIALRKVSKPERLPDLDWEPVVDYVQSATDSLEAGEGLPKDFEHYLYEMVLETVYGEDVWKWWNRHQ